jgi:hypothetical protein
MPLVREKRSYPMSYPNTCILTWSGKMLDLANPRPEDICLEDIASGLANTIRYRGALGVPLTVAQHSVLLSYWTGFTDEQRRFALLHDAAEAYLGDIPAPAHRLMEFREYFIHVCNRLFDVIGIKYLGYPEKTDPRPYAAVYQADKALVAYEVATFGDSEWRQRACFSQAAWLELWGEVPTLTEADEYAVGSYVWGSDLARKLFLERAANLGVVDK